MNQADLRQLAQERIADSGALLAAGRWSYAYYTGGYAVECALKACVLSRMVVTGWIFSDPKVKIDEVFTHSFSKLIRIAGLENELDNRLKAAVAPAGAAAGATAGTGAGMAPGAGAVGAAVGAGNVFAGFWGVVTRWDVASRYSMSSEADARELYTAITDMNDGILPWLRNYW